MQAITTKFIAPTDTKGSRIKARCQAGSVTISFPYEDNDHSYAALALCVKLGWKGRWMSGGLPDGTGEAFVCVDPGAPLRVNGLFPESEG